MNVLQQRRTPTLEFDAFAHLEMSEFPADSLPWNACDVQTGQSWPVPTSHNPGWPYDNDWSEPWFSAASMLSEASPEYSENRTPMTDPSTPANRAHCPPPQEQADDWLELTMWDAGPPKPLGLQSWAPSCRAQSPPDEWLDCTTWAANPLGNASAAGSSSSPVAAAVLGTRRPASPVQLDQLPRDVTWDADDALSLARRRHETRAVLWPAAPATPPDWSWTTPMPLDQEASPATAAAAQHTSPSPDDERGRQRHRASSFKPQQRPAVVGDLMERNRAAATSSRLRQREMEGNLVAEVRTARDRNRALHRCVEDLTGEVLRLKMEVLRHARCNSKLIYRYIHRTAEQHLQSL